MADLGRDDRLGARRQRGVADGQLLVVGEVARLLLVGEGVAAQMQREHEVGLLDDLLAVQVEVREVQQQRVLLGARVAAKSQTSCSVKRLGLRMDFELLVVGDEHRVGGVAPAGASSSSTPSSAARCGWRSSGVGRGAQVALRHQVRVDVVVGDRAVLVGAGDAVDPEAPGVVVVAERAPQPRRLDEQLEADAVPRTPRRRWPPDSARPRRRCRR